MKVDVTKVLKNLRGDELQSPTLQCEHCGNVIEGTPVTLRGVLVEALLRPRAPDQGQPQLTGEEKLKVYQLAQRVYDEDEPELDSEEIVSLKAKVAEISPPMVTGQAWMMLEGRL